MPFSFLHLLFELNWNLKLQHWAIFRGDGRVSYDFFICGLAQTSKDPILTFPFKRNWHPAKARHINLIFLNLNLNHSLHLTLTLNL